MTTQWTSFSFLRVSTAVYSVYLEEKQHLYNDTATCKTNFIRKLTAVIGIGVKSRHKTPFQPQSTVANTIPADKHVLALTLAVLRFFLHSLLLCFVNGVPM